MDKRTKNNLYIVHYADITSALHCGVNALHYGLIWGQSRSKMAEDVGLESFRPKRFFSCEDVPVRDQAKAVLIQNCYLAVFLGLQPKKSLDGYAAQGVGQLN